MKLGEQIARQGKQIFKRKNVNFKFTFPALEIYFYVCNSK